MRAGTLRYPVRILKPSKTRDSFGAPLTSGPMDLEGASVVWIGFAAIDPMQARESDQLRQNLSEVFHTVRIRYFEGISPAMVIHVENDGRLLSILGVQDKSGRRQEWHISAKEVHGWKA